MLPPTAILIGTISNVIAHAYQLARQRLASVGSPILRLMMSRNHAVMEVALLERELAVLRGQREMMKPKSRPDYTGVQRLEIIQIMRLRGWTVAQVAARFVLHPNTVRAWLRALNNESDATQNCLPLRCGIDFMTRSGGQLKRFVEFARSRRWARERSLR
jgi:hypothetical protein